MTTHVVMFRFHDAADVTEARERLNAMMGEVPGLLSVEVGSDHNRSDAAHDLVLVTVHEDREALRQYADHPAHVAVKDWLSSRTKERAVVDTDDF